jgi:hypothetical protein
MAWNYPAKRSEHETNGISGMILMRSEKCPSIPRKGSSPCRVAGGSGGIAAILLVVLSALLSGCIGNNVYQNMTPEDSAFLRTADEMPIGQWAANVPSELMGDYQKMYDIARAQKEIDENRIRVLRPMPVSEGFRDIKEELLLSDEFSIRASEYEMNWTRAMMASDRVSAGRWWDLEEEAMDESINHTVRADKMICAKYGLQCPLTSFF